MEDTQRKDSKSNWRACGDLQGCNPFQDVRKVSVVLNLVSFLFCFPSCRFITEPKVKYYGDLYV